MSWGCCVCWVCWDWAWGWAWGWGLLKVIKFVFLVDLKLLYFFYLFVANQRGSTF